MASNARKLTVASNKYTQDEWQRLIKARMTECPFRKKEMYCTMYSGVTDFCNGACAFVIDYLRRQ